jgi:hypothetical protein
MYLLVWPSSVELEGNHFRTEPLNITELEKNLHVSNNRTLKVVELDQDGNEETGGFENHF